MKITVLRVHTDDIASVHNLLSKPVFHQFLYVKLILYLIQYVKARNCQTKLPPLDQG